MSVFQNGKGGTATNSRDKKHTSVVEKKKAGPGGGKKMVTYFTGDRKGSFFPWRSLKSKKTLGPKRGETKRGWERGKRGKNS